MRNLLSGADVRYMPTNVSGLVEHLSMTPDMSQIFLDAFFTTARSIASGFWQAFLANPWPWLAIAAGMILLALLPTRRRRRRRSW